MITSIIVVTAIIALDKLSKISFQNNKNDILYIESKKTNLSNTIHNANDEGSIKLCKLYYVDKNNESLFTCF